MALIGSFNENNLCLIGNYLSKGGVSVVLSDPPCKDGNAAMWYPAFFDQI